MNLLLELLIICALAPMRAQSQDTSATAILRHAERAVRIADLRGDSLSGTFRVTVRLSSDVIGRVSKATSSYMVTFASGKDTSIEPVGNATASDSEASKMMQREADKQFDKPALHIYDAAFPWEPILAQSTQKSSVTFKLASDSSVVSGKACHVIEFHLDAQGDSIGAEGDGRVWIERGTFLPVRTYYDLTLRTIRGKAEVQAFSDFRLLPKGVPVLIRSEIQTIPKFLFVKVGSIKIIIEQSDFNLE